ncbi:hypothetical protein SFRURICE_000009 [Spodoptera frugiperda]|nr:hypothetical protein SFRURICE_000009 [Spodoptera frugiperda]
MASNSFLASVPKLKGRENYHEWAFAAENMLTNVNKPDKSHITCHRCGNTGHYKNQCSVQKNTQQNKKTHAFSAVFLNGKYSKENFYLDSGASCHMTTDVNKVQNASFSPSVSEIMAANGSSMAVQCSGDVQIVTITPDCKFEVTLKDCLCVPNLATNLISISQLHKSGNRVRFLPDRCNVYNRNKELVAVAFETDGQSGDVEDDEPGLPEPPEPVSAPEEAAPQSPGPQDLLVKRVRKQPERDVLFICCSWGVRMRYLFTLVTSNKHCSAVKGVQRAAHSARALASDACAECGQTV